ncbi:MAG TPA: CDP-diacylglycerol--glycerol-3-phosphate 3-phosphatidyltransferase [Micromonosporaceae bacterium]|nr:CDP-diacylglycerol--glycerol-3-phosphate 3-phosphatidyltransferase [Micromonosporaceae bacterium]
MTGANEPAAAATVAPVPVVNAANGITALRLVLVPIFVLLVVASELTAPAWRIAASLTFVFASATDLVDGWIARRYGLVTSFGKVADPIADKALTGSALVMLSAYDRIPWWVTLVILGREIGVTLIRFSVIRHGVIPASRGGKAKTALQILAIVWYLWPVPQALTVVGPWILAAAVVATVLSGAYYVLQALRLRARATTAGADERPDDAAG